MTGQEEAETGPVELRYSGLQPVKLRKEVGEGVEGEGGRSNGWRQGTKWTAFPTEIDHSSDQEPVHTYTHTHTHTK